MNQARQSKLNNLVATVGSLNDELRKTNSEIESAHVERATLLTTVELLRNEKISLATEIKDVRESKEGLARKSEDLRLDIIRKEKELKGLSLDFHFASEELKLIQARKLKEVTELTRDSSKLSETIEKKTEELAGLEREIHTTVGVINQLKESITLGEFQLKQVIDKRRIELDDSKRELKKITDKRNSIEKKLADDQKNLNALIKDWESKNKDMLVVQRRLKQKWQKDNPNTPFPLIKWPELLNQQEE